MPEFWDQDTQGQVPSLVQPLIGQTVLWAGIDQHTLILRFAGHTMMVEAAAGVGMEVMSLEVGPHKLGADFSDVEAMPQLQSPQTRLLVGSKLTGIDRNVLVFDQQYGAQITRAGVVWVRRPEAPTWPGFH